MIIKKSRSIYITILTLAIPIVIQQVTQALQIMIDQFLLGKYESSGILLSVTGNVMPVLMIFSFFFFSMGMGITALMAQYIGAGKLDQAERVAESSFLFTTLFTLASYFIFTLFTRRIFHLMGVDPDIMEPAVLYGRIVSLNLILLGVEITAASALQAAGITFIIMVISLLKNIMNIVLNILLIFGVGFFPELGLKGAAIATVISSSGGSLILFLIFLFSRKIPFAITMGGILKSRWKIYTQALKMGLPTAFESILWRAGQMVVIVLINTIDKYAMGVFSVLGSVQFLVISLYTGFSRAALTLTGQAWGAKNYKTGILRGFQCLFLTVGVCVSASAILAVFPRQILSFFTENTDFINRGIPLVRIMAITIFGQALNIVMGHSIRASGDPRWMTFSQAWGTTFVIIVSIIAILGFDRGLEGLFLTVMADEWIRGIINMFYFLKKRRNPQKLFLMKAPVVNS